jgi:hypothetical protein
MCQKGSNPNSLSSRSNGGARPRVVPSKLPGPHRKAVAGRPPLFSGISADDYAAISAAARAKEFTRGEVLYLEGDAVELVLLLTSGSVKTTRLGLSGVEVILRLWVPGDVLDPADLLAGGRHSSTAQAFRLTRALVWDATSFKALAGAIRSWTRTCSAWWCGIWRTWKSASANWPLKESVRGWLVSWCDCCRRSAGRPRGPSKWVFHAKSWRK